MAGIADPAPQAEAYARENGFPYFKDAEALLDKTKPDGVIVANPNAMHRLTALACIARGIPAIIAESGRCGLVEEEAIQRHVDGVLNIWRTLGLLTDRPPTVHEPPRTLSRFEWLRSPHEGIFLCEVRVSDKVGKGQVLGRMVDLLGNPLVEITSPDDGVVLFVVTSPAIKRDGLLLGVGVP